MKGAHGLLVSDCFTWCVRVVCCLLVWRLPLGAFRGERLPRALAIELQLLSQPNGIAPLLRSLPPLSAPVSHPLDARLETVEL